MLLKIRGFLIIVQYLLEKGAKLKPLSVTIAELTANVQKLKWVLEKTGTKITPELDAALTSSPRYVIKYTLEHLLPKEAILIGITNDEYHFTNSIGKVASQLMEENPNIFIIPLTEGIVFDDSLMIQFSGFINPGGGDSYPKHMQTFSFKDIDEIKLSDPEKLYQRVISFAKNTIFLIWVFA